MMSKAKFDAAKQLIQEKQYDQARMLLKTIDHPTARQWETKLNTIAPALVVQPIKPKRKWTPKKILLLFVLSIPTTCILIAVLTTLIGNAQRNTQRQAVSQSAAEMSVRLARSCDAMSYWDNFQRSACRDAAKDFETCSNRGGTYEFMTLCLNLHQSMICTIIYGSDIEGADACVAKGNQTLTPAPAS